MQKGYKTTVVLPEDIHKSEVSLGELLEIALEKKRIFPGNETPVRAYALMQLAQTWQDDDTILFAEQKDNDL